MGDRSEFSLTKRPGRNAAVRGADQAPNVREIGWVGDDDALARALVEGHPGAPAELFDRHGAHVQRVLVNILGFDPELPDLLHEVFARALKGLGGLRDGSRLKAWLTQIAVFVARESIRSRSRHRWLRLSPPDELPQTPTLDVPPETREAIWCTYELLGKLKADQRIAFTLRFINGMELTDVAAACGVSLSTIRRRLAKAEKRFVMLASRDPALASWVAEGNRWRPK